MIENFFLQATTTTSNDLSWIAITIAAISAAGVISSFLLNYKIASKTNDAKYAELFSRYIQELQIIEEKRINLRNHPKSEILSNTCNFLNKVEEIVFLNSKGKIPSDLTEYFKQYIEDAYSILEHTDGVNFDGDVIQKKQWHHLLDWCEKHKVLKLGKAEGAPTYLADLLENLEEPTKGFESKIK